MPALRNLKKTLVIGAGPAGLSAAYCLAKKGFPVEVLEAGPEVGGMARTITLWGQKVDLGPHRFFTTDPKVNELWHEIVAGDYALVDRKTRILYKETFFSYPLKPFEALWRLGPVEAAHCLMSFLRPPSKQPPKNFQDWVTKRFGKRLFEIFFKTYSEKLWGIPCSEIDTDFADQRIQKFSLGEALIASFGRKGTQHKTLVDRFAYPLQGTGSVYLRMRQRIEEAGGKVSTLSKVTGIETTGDRVTGVRLNDGTLLPADHVVSTMPLTRLLEALPEAPANLRQHAGRLGFRNTILVYLNVAHPNLFPDNWIYVHAENLLTGRITNFRNWVPTLYGEQTSTILCLEYWAQPEDALWKKSEAELVKLATDELRQTGLDRGAEVSAGAVVKLPRSYPIYRRGYRSDLQPILNYLGTVQGLSVIGRYGSFKYNNQDHSLLMGILAAENIADGASHDLAGVNVDSRYQESGPCLPTLSLNPRLA